MSYGTQGRNSVRPYVRTYVPPPAQAQAPWRLAGAWGLPEAGLDLPKACSGLPEAGLGLPEAGLGLPKAGFGLPKAGSALPKAGLGLQRLAGADFYPPVQA